jgi:hypothetical protein
VEVLLRLTMTSPKRTIFSVMPTEIRRGATTLVFVVTLLMKKTVEIIGFVADRKTQVAILTYKINVKDKSGNNNVCQIKS